MEINCVAMVKIQKGLCRDESFIKRIFIGLDDLPEDISSSEVKDLVGREVDSQLECSDDFRHYGRNWELVDIENC